MIGLLVYSRRWLYFFGGFGGFGLSLVPSFAQQQQHAREREYLDDTNQGCW